MTPSWHQTGIIYQIYPRSFADSNGDGIGDLNGITAHLDYLADLGVDAIWLSPIYPSPDVDFGYDVSDYCAVDPKFGTLEDFDRLVTEARKRNIHIIMDLVLNHTSDQHSWFIESKSSRDNPRRDWYLWADPAPGGGPPNNWQSVFGGPGWEFDPSTGQYYFHMFYKQQPDVNWQNPAVRTAMLDVFRFWLDRGADGFRLDVFNAYFKHPRLASNPSALGIPLYSFSWQRHVNDVNRPEMIPLVQEIRALLDSYEARDGTPRFVVGETFISNVEQTAAYCGPDRLNTAFNFEIIGERQLNAHSMMRKILRWEQALGPDAWPNYVFNNHDVVRTASRWKPWFSSSPEDDARLKLAAALLLTLRGTPFIYYGEEIGMRDIPIFSRADVLDPVGKTFWPFMKGRDGCRAPMQWSGAENAGFSAPGARPWLPLHTDYPRRNVQVQCVDARSLLQTYRRLIEIRRATPALTTGMFLPITYGTRYILAFLRQTSDQTVLVAMNISPRRQRLVLGSHLARQDWTLLFSTHRDSLPPVGRSLLALEPFEAVILKA